MRWRLAALVAAVLGALASPRLDAHHALLVEYRVDEEITVSGIVGDCAIGNPHILIRLNVRTPHGDEEWLAEGGSHTTLLRRGWTGKELKPGDEVRVVGYPAKHGSKTVHWRKLYGADGTELWGTRPAHRP